MPEECATITADEADEYVDVVGSSNPVHSDMESEGFTFRESVSHAFLKDFGGFLILLAFPCFSFFILIFTLPKRSLVDFTFWPLCNSFEASYFRAHYILKMAS